LNKLSQKYNQSGLLIALKCIFARPYLAALIVGSFINIGKWLNYVVHDTNYVASIVRLKADGGYVFAAVDQLMPYVVPFIVITISRKLAKITEQAFYDTFPDLNPDIVIKCNLAGMPQYFNTTAKDFLSDNDIPAENIETLIPLKITSINIDQLPCRLEHVVSGEKIEYLISKSDNEELFLSGRIRQSLAK